MATTATMFRGLKLSWLFCQLFYVLVMSRSEVSTIDHPIVFHPIMFTKFGFAFRFSSLKQFEITYHYRAILLTDHHQTPPPCVESFLKSSLKVSQSGVQSFVSGVQSLVACSKFGS